MKKLVLILAIFSQVTFLLAQNITLSVTGQVLSSNTLNPIPYHVVEIQVIYNSPSNTPIHDSIFTANDGSYSFSTILFAQNAVVYLSTTNNYGVQSTAVYTVTVPPSSLTATVNHIFYIDDDTIPSNCVANYYYTVQYPDSLTLSFTDQSYSNSSNLNYFWSFGDGTSSTLQNPTHTFPAYGFYQVCLTIYDTLCQSTYCNDILIGHLPDTNNVPCAANFSYTQSPSPSTNLSTFSFTDLSTGNPTAWMWNFGDGGTSTLQNPTHTYTSNGIYLVTLTITNGLTQCTSTFVGYLSVDSIWTTNCQSAFSWYPGNVPYNVGFYDFSMGNNIQSWYWTFGDGTTSTQQHPFHSYGGPGQFQVCLTITSGNNCTSTWCNYVQVDTFNFCNNYFTYQTSGNTILFNGTHTGAPAVNYQWSFGDGTSGIGQQVTHTYTNPGTYYVSLISTDTVGCTAISDQIIVVSGGTFNQIYGQVFSGNFPLLQGYVLLYSDDANPAQLSYFDVAPIDSMGVYVFSQVPNGNYYILAVPFNVAGYLPTYFGNVIDWANATVITVPPINVPPTTNLYNIYLVAATGTQVSGVGSINGTVYTNSIASNIFSNMKILLYDENQNPITYSGIQNLNYFSFQNLALKTYYVKPQLPGYESELTRISLTDQNSVINLQITVDGNHLILGIEESNPQFAVEGIYPNPASENVTISIYSADHQTSIVKVFDSNGKIVKVQSINLLVGDNSIDLNVQPWANGIYFIQILTEKGEQSTQKLFKN